MTTELPETPVSDPTVGAPPDMPFAWHQINWRHAERTVRRLQTRIAQATQVMVHQTLRLNATLILTTAAVNRVSTKRKGKTSQPGALLAVARMVSSVVIPISMPSETRASRGADRRWEPGQWRPGRAFAQRCC